jgi:hypothetical protein
MHHIAHNAPVRLFPYSSASINPVVHKFIDGAVETLESYPIIELLITKDELP